MEEGEEKAARGKKKRRDVRSFCMHIWKNTKVWEAELIFITSGTDYWFVSIRCKSMADPTLLAAFHLQSKHSALHFGLLIVLHGQTYFPRLICKARNAQGNLPLDSTILQREHYCSHYTLIKLQVEILWSFSIIKQRLIVLVMFLKHWDDATELTESQHPSLADVFPMQGLAEVQCLTWLFLCVQDLRLWRPSVRGWR